MTTPTVAQAQPRSTRKRSGGLAALKEIVLIVGCALVLSFLIKTFLVQSFYIPSQSMEDTLTRGDRVMVSRLAPGPVELQRGDIVVFEDPGGWLGHDMMIERGVFGNAVTAGLTAVGLLPADTGEHLIKRLIGMPGDHVVCDAVCARSGGPIKINGTPVEETAYLEPGTAPSADMPFDVVVPDEMLFVMGDNRQFSADSRVNTDKPGGGFVPMENVTGAAFATVWPFDRATWLTNPADVFAAVPAPGPAS